MDQASAAAITAYTPGSMEYQMLMMRYQNGIADSMGLRPDDVHVNGTRPLCP